MSSITGLISGGGGGGIAPNQYTLDTLPFFVIDRGRVQSNNVGNPRDPLFFTGEAYSRDLQDAPSGFIATKGTGWSTVYNHVGSGTFGWFLSTSIGNINGQIIVKLTVDGQSRSFNVTASDAENDRFSVFVGTSTLWRSATVNNSSIFGAWNGTINSSIRFNSTIAAASADLSVYFNSSAILSGFQPVLKYETDFKIEVYNSNITFGDAGNYCGGMVIQGY